MTEVKSEIKDNSVKFFGTIANMTNKSRKDGKITVLRVEVPSQDLRGQMEALADSVDDSVEITVAPNQTELHLISHYLFTSAWLPKV